MNMTHCKPNSRRWLCAILPVLALAYGTTASAASGFMRSVGTSEVAPRIFLMGRGIATFDGSFKNPTAGGTKTSSLINFSDSFLDAQFASRLYSGVHGGMLLGLRFPEAGSGLGPAFYHQVNVFLEARRWGLRIGRTSLPNYLIAFPTPRDGDLIDYTQVPNNNLTGNQASEYSQYGNVLKGDYYWLNSRLRLTGFVANQLSGTTGNSLNRFSLNSGGAQINYELVPGERYASWLRQLGAEIYYQDVHHIPGKRRQYSYLIGGVINLNRDPIDYWELRFQVIDNEGAGVTSVTTVQNQAHTRSQSYVVSIRRVRSPYLMPRLQTAVTMAYQHFDGINANRYSVIPNIMYRLGANTSLIAQYAYTHNQGMLQNATDRFKSDNTVTLGLTYAFGTTSNNYFGNRTSLLNVEHGYLP